MAVTKRPTIQYVRQNIIEERLTGAIVPAGNLVSLNSSDVFINATAPGLNLVAVEDGVQVADETESYASGERCKAYVFTAGEKAYLNLADGETSAIGSGLAHNGDGSVKVADAAVAASAETGVVGSNNAITYTANTAGADGNLIEVALIDPAGNDQALAVSTSDNYIAVSLKTGSGGAIESTAAEVIAAINLVPGIRITASNTDTSTGAGVVAAVAVFNLEDGADAGVSIATALEVVAASGSTDKVLTIFN